MAFRSAINSVTSVADSVGSNEDGSDETENIDENGQKVNMAGAVVTALWAKKSGVNWAKDSFKKGKSGK